MVWGRSLELVGNRGWRPMVGRMAEKQPHAQQRTRRRNRAWGLRGPIVVVMVVTCGGGGDWAASGSGRVLVLG